MTFNPRPPRHIDVTVDREGEAHATRKLAYDFGGTDEQAQRAAKVTVAALSIDPANGDPLYAVEGRSQPIRGVGGRVLIVQELLARDRLLAFGSPPENSVTDRLVARGYTADEIAAEFRTAGIGRNKDGMMRFEGRSGTDEVMIPIAVGLIAKKIEAKRRAAAITPEMMSEMGKRGYGI